MTISPAASPAASIDDTRSAHGAEPFADRAPYDAAVETARAAAATYYDSDQLLMSDVEYDELVARIEATEALRPDWDSGGLTSAVAGGASAGGDVEHSEPMLSLGKAHSTAEIDAWHARLSGLLGREAPLVIEPKLDGVALAVRYVDGKLTQVITRGDGISGEDVTAQVAGDATVGMPAELAEPATFEVRGECFLSADQYDEANRLRVEVDGKAPFVNPRNAVAGTVRAIHRTYSAPLTFAVYSLHGHEAATSDPHSAQMSWLAGLGFQPASTLVGDPTPVRSAADAIARVEAIGALRASLTFEIDGAVIKADAPEDRTEAGATGSHPRWAVAFKYPAEERTTILLDIDITPGRTGALVPRAILEPVFVAGTTVSFATLHNMEILAALDARPGDTVLVKRAGDVIPRVEGVILAARPEGSVPWQPPTSCPRCDAEIDRSEKRWRCSRGRLCGAKELISYAVARDAYDIEGLGDTLIDRLVDAGVVADLADVFTLDADKLAGIERMGEATVTKLVANIEGAKAQPLSRLVTALGIRMTGRRMSRRLARHFGTLDALRAASVTELAEVEGVGDARAQSIAVELAEISDLVDRLVAVGVNTVDEHAGASEDDAGAKPLDGKTVVVSGTIPGMSRTEAQEAAEKLGAKTSGSVSAKTSILIAGPGAGSKLAKAEKLGVEVMDGADFAALVAANVS